MNLDYDLNAEELVQEIKEVRNHWELLNQSLNWLQDGRSIEQISYEMLADERRYGYLLQLAKEKHIHAPIMIREEG